MKKIFSIITILFIIALSNGHAYDRGHTWDNGVVESIYEETYKGPDSSGRIKSTTHDMMNISGNKYKVAPDCVVYELFKKDVSGAADRRKGRIEDINVGDRVLIKRIGRILIEISIGE